MKREKVSAFFKSKGFYVSLFTGIFAVFVLTMVYANVNSVKRQSEDELAKQDTPGNLAEVNPAGEGAIGVKPDVAAGQEQTQTGQKDTSTGSDTTEANGAGQTAGKSDVTGSATPDNQTASNDTAQENASQAGDLAQGDAAGHDVSTDNNVAEDTSSVADGEKPADGQDLASNLELESEYGAAASAEAGENGQDLASQGETNSNLAANTPGETDSLDGAAEPVASVQPNQNLLQNLHFQEENGLLWPAEGAIIKNYSMEKLVYFETLEQFKCNPAVLIGLEVGSDVLCGAQGVVTAITESEELGNSILIDIGDGYQLRYAQLQDLKVQVGDVVEEGAVLAQVAEPTIYYTKEGSNLYFQVLQNGETVNPLLLLR